MENTPSTVHARSGFAWAINSETLGDPGILESADSSNQVGFTMLNNTRNILHESGKVTVTCLLCLVSLCVSVTAVAQNELIISGFGTAKIDGVKQSGEWSSAGRVVFDAHMEELESDRKAFAILYAMNSSDPPQEWF